MRTMFHSTEGWSCDGLFDCWPLAAMLGCTRRRPARLFKLSKLTQQLFRQLLYAHYECFAFSVSVHYVFGECAIRRATIFWFYTSDFDLGSNFWHFCLSFYSECEILNDACTTMPLIYPSLCTWLCVFFLFCVSWQFWRNTQWDRVRFSDRRKIAASSCTLDTACVGVRAEWTLMPGNSCHYLWALSAPTVAASLGRGQGWSVIADTATRLEPCVQIPWTPSPCHLPNELITPLGFFANMIP